MRISDWSSDVALPIFRDAYYTVEALNRLGALDVLEGYLAYLRNIVDDARTGAKDGHIQPLYDVRGHARLEEREEPALAGSRGLGPVRIGNQAYEQVQHDAYGQIVLSSVQAYIVTRLYRIGGHEDFSTLGNASRRDRVWQYGT